MSRHPPFKVLEATRPDFDTSLQFEVTKMPAPEWVPGTGANGRQDLPGVKQGLWTGTGGTYKEIDPDNAPIAGIYKMMISAITPRPIGFVSSVDANGVANLAPFSYFNMVCHNPPMIMVSFTHPSATRLKDSCANILETKDFAVSIISEPFVEAANYSCIDAPADVNEWTLAGLTPIPSTVIKSPRVGESAFSMECELAHHYDIHNDENVLTGTVVLGRVKRFHVRDDIISEDLIVDTSLLQPVSRLGGISYGRTVTTYETPRPVWEVESKRPEVLAALAKSKV